MKTNICDFCSDSCTLCSSTEESTLNGMYLLPVGANSFLLGSKFFSFRVDPFSEGRQNSSERVTSLNV